ncbi:MAG: ribose 5-phosphate isomerase B [Ignavibacteriales bacterium CG12_big_fil_rev_8_21_14_0_65_30_8]|nr:MAG: ribose 5-phosphate isomerase B [Ignavibacteriales bacterium CG12_big_fil_rev_8_21_14_0_65_30_8]
MKKLITENDVIKFAQSGGNVLPISEDDIVTPLALDQIKTLGIGVIKKNSADNIPLTINEIEQSQTSKSIAIGSDHTGFRIKNILSKILSDKGYEIIDVGTYDEKSCDYPDFAFAVARKVKEKIVKFGIIIDATGIPSAITANKLKGIRASTCYNEFSAKSSREHNNANVLVLGAKTLGEETIKSILDTWLNTNFGGGRHQNRLNKITEIENNHLS